MVSLSRDKLHWQWYPAAQHSTAQHVHTCAINCFGWYRYLSFVQGIVDSDTLPLQVSRESLQQHAALKTMKKKLVRKALDMIKKLADAETSFEAEDADSKPLHTLLLCSALLSSAMPCSVLFVASMLRVYICIT